MHEYDFVVDVIFEKEVCEISDILQLSKSETMRYILDITYPYLEKKHFFSRRGLSEEAKYKKSERLKVWLPKRLYRRIKQVHDQLNTGSMAIIVRYLIQWFLDELKEHGLNGVLKILKTTEKRLTALKDGKRSLLKPDRDIPFCGDRNLYYWLFFDSDFCLREIKLLKSG